MSIEELDFNKINCRNDDDFRRKMSESHDCVDCGYNTLPGALNRAEAEESYKQAKLAGMAKSWSTEITLGPQAEQYYVRDSIWKKAGMEPWGGCLCIGCLEKRIGRKLKPKDFDHNHPFNYSPGTERLMRRRGQLRG